MASDNLIDSDSARQAEDASGAVPVAACWACETLERTPLTDAASLYEIADRCRCGCVTPDTLHELAAYALSDAYDAGPSDR